MLARCSLPSPSWPQQRGRWKPSACPSAVHLHPPLPAPAPAAPENNKRSRSGTLFKFATAQTAAASKHCESTMSRAADKAARVQVAQDTTRQCCAGRAHRTCSALPTKLSSNVCSCSRRNWEYMPALLSKVSRLRHDSVFSMLSSPFSRRACANIATSQRGLTAHRR